MTQIIDLHRRAPYVPPNDWPCDSEIAAAYPLLISDTTALERMRDRRRLKWIHRTLMFANLVVWAFFAVMYVMQVGGSR